MVTAATWGQVRPGAMVRLKGAAWEVTAKDGTVVTVRHPGTGRTVTRDLPPSMPVTLLEVPNPEEAAAAAMVAALTERAQATLAAATARIHLGAAVIATEGPDGLVCHTADRWHLYLLAAVIATEGPDGLVCHTADRWHLYLLHRFDAEVPDDASPKLLERLHSAATARKPHTHAPLS